ncbi:MAG: hypothetical protein NXH70_02055 [Hyphomonas sp.]|nr:hypothetical protein [Hyphomonas sp.]
MSAVAGEWEKNESVDAFTDETVVYYRLEGEVVGNLDRKNTSLIYRDRNDEIEMYWNTPFSFICDAKAPDIMVRFGDDKPEKASTAGISTDNEAVFFSSPAYVAANMRKHDSMMIRLSDHCGNQGTVKFNGGFPEEVTRYDALVNTDWKLSPGGGLTRLEGDAGFKLSSLRPAWSVDNEPTALFYLKKDAQHLPKYQYRVELQIGSQRGHAVIRTTEQWSSLDGYHTGFMDDITTDEFLQALKEDPTLKATVNGQTYTVDLSGLTPEILATFENTSE